MTRTLEQNTKFHKLVGLRKLDKEDKQALVMECSGGRTTSSATMTVQEMALAITILDSEQTSSLKKMRAKIIHVARDIFGMAPKDVWGQEHYDRLNKFLLDKFKCPLHKLTYQQLPNAVTAMEAWRGWKTKKMVNELLNAI
ncbi:NinB/YbcN family protein [Spirosoma areae]